MINNLFSLILITLSQSQAIGNRESYLIYFFVSVVVVEVDSLVVVGSSAEAGVVTLLVEVEVEVDSFSLLQPANNAKVTKPTAIISLFFIVLSYISFINTVS